MICIAISFTEILQFSDFDPAIKRPISSRYGRGLFQQIFGAHGKTFNVG